jgi:hypothetical protein
MDSSFDIKPKENKSGIYSIVDFLALNLQQSIKINHVKTILSSVQG